MYRILCSDAKSYHVRYIYPSFANTRSPLPQFDQRGDDSSIYEMDCTVDQECGNTVDQAWVCGRNERLRLNMIACDIAEIMNKICCRRRQYRIQPCKIAYPANRNLDSGSPSKPREIAQVVEFDSIGNGFLASFSNGTVPSMSSETCWRWQRTVAFNLKDACIVLMCSSNVQNREPAGLSLSRLGGSFRP